MVLISIFHLPFQLQNLLMSMVQSGCDLDLINELIEVEKLQTLTVEMVVRAALNSAIVGFL